MDIPSNSAKIDWPTDRAGITSRLKREGCRAIGRMSGDRENLDVVMDVLRILAQHAKDKFAEQEDITRGNLAKLAKQRQDAQDANDRAEIAMENDLKAQAETLKNRIAALEARKRRIVEQVIPASDAKAQQGIGTAKS